MWPQGTNKSFLIGISDYFEDIRSNDSSLSDSDKSDLNTICSSLQRIISNSHRSNGKRSGGPSSSTPYGGYEDFEHKTPDGSDAYTIDKKVRKFFEWSQNMIIFSPDDPSKNNWQELVGLFNFQFPQYEIPSDVDVTTYHATFLCKYCKEKGNELMKNKKIKNAIEMYTKAIQLLENEKIKNDEESQLLEEEKKVKSSKCEVAIIYCNRSAAYVYLQEYQKAVDDAVFALKNDPLLTKAWIRKGMAEQELKRFQIAYGDYQVALNQSKQSDNYYKFLIKKIKQCFDQILIQHSSTNNIGSTHSNNNSTINSPHSTTQHDDIGDNKPKSMQTQ